MREGKVTYTHTLVMLSVNNVVNTLPLQATKAGRLGLKRSVALREMDCYTNLSNVTAYLRTHPYPLLSVSSWPKALSRSIFWRSPIRK